jgi:uncharacterized protein YbjQ (UPF0145 family)
VDDLNIILALLLLLVAFFTGEIIERRHVKSIRSRERRWMRLPAITFRQIPGSWDVEQSDLVQGSVVVSVDHFKRFLASLRQIFGGRVKSYESLMDRARREALLRLKKDAMDKGFHAVVNVRLETSRMANGKGSQGTAGLEVFAYGTGLKLRNGPA